MRRILSGAIEQKCRCSDLSAIEIEVIGESWAHGVGQGIEERIARLGQSVAVVEIIQKVPCFVVDEFKIRISG